MISASGATARTFTCPPPLALWLLAGIALAGVVTLLFTRRARRDSTDPARLAGSRELKPLRIPGPVRGRVTLGSHDRRLLAAAPRTSVAVIGPSQSGKTSGLVIPAVLEWDGPVLSTSVKSDVAGDTYTARTNRGR